MENIQEQIEKVIKENMPEAQAKAFKEFIQSAEDNKLKIISLRSDKETNVTTIKNLRKRIEELEKLQLQKHELMRTEEGLNVVRKQLNEERRGLSNIILTEKLNSANQIIENNMKLLESLFGNKVVADTMFSGNFGINIPKKNEYGVVDYERVDGDIDLTKKKVEE